MNTINEGLLGFGLLTLTLWFFYLTNMLSYCAIGQQHELFNELGTIVRFLEISTDRLTFLINIEVKFLTIKLHCPTLEAAFTQFLGKFIQSAQLFGIIAILSRQYLLYLLIGIAAIALNHGMGYVVVLHIGIFV